MTAYSMKKYIEEEMNREKAKLKQMTWRQKADYIWTYYKPHMFGIVAGLVILFNVIQLGYRATFDTALSFMILNNYHGTTNVAPITEGFYQAKGMTKKQVINSVVEILAEDEDANREHNYAVTTKLAALITVKDLDVLIADEETVKKYSKEDVIFPLDTMLTRKEIEEMGDRLIYAEGEDGKSFLAAINVGKTALAEQMDLQEPAECFMIISNSQRIPCARELLLYFLTGK